MPWLHPDTICTNAQRISAIQKYGKKLASEWCSVWDWGERAKDPETHLSMVLKRIEKDVNQIEEKETQEILLEFKEKAKTYLKKRRAKLKNNQEN